MRNGGLDAIRLGAAGLVFLAHARLALGIGDDAGLGMVGVCLFFVLSGYLIPTVYLRSASIRDYAARRLLRIIPAYVFAVLGLGVVFGYSVTLRDVLMLQTFDLGRFDTFMGVAWTLQLEIVFYAAVPFLARLPMRWIAGLGAASLMGFVLIPDRGLAGTFPLRFWMFVPGMLLVGRTLPEVSVPRWVTFGSTISYGVYLWHHEILRALRDMGLHPAAVIVGGAALTLLAAIVSWYAIERPFLRAKQPANERHETFPARPEINIRGALN